MRKNYVAAIVHALKIWSHYFLGRTFILMAYHRGLMYLSDQPKLNARHARWLAFISEFDFEIKYNKGKEKKVVDALKKRLQVAHVTTINTYELTSKKR